MKTFLIAANWKMNKTLEEAVEFMRKIKDSKAKNDMIIFPPYPLIYPLHEALGKSKILLGAQNMHQKESGAFTGEVCASMIKSCGASWVLLGHSERRQLFHEDNALINAKIHAALKADLNVMLCIGETQEQRAVGNTEDILKEQLTGCLSDVFAQHMEKIAIAYEPIWAIGTGKVATPDQAQKAHHFIRHLLAALYNDTIAKKVRILYGGSVTDENVSSLFKEKDINGALVGGASLDAQKFLKIANA